MKKICFLTLMILGLNVFSQTDSTEKAVYFAEFKANKVTASDLYDIGLRWNQLLDKFGQYPNLPLNEKGEVHFSFTIDLDGFTKESIINRTKEFLTLNYGLLPSDYYSNTEEGKLIFIAKKQMNPVYSLFYTSIITVIDNKMLIEFLRIGFNEIHKEQFSVDRWIPERRSEYSINRVFPIILKKPSDWEKNLKLLKYTNSHFSNTKELLIDYILEYNSKYKF
jgi:hypothetical protein